MGEQKSKGPKIVLCTVIAFVGMLLGGVANTAGYPLINGIIIMITVSVLFAVWKN